MLGKTSAMCTLYLLACLFSLTSTAAMARHHQRHHLRGEGRLRGGRHHQQRGSNNNDDNGNNDDKGRRQGYRDHGDLNDSYPFQDYGQEDDDDGLGYYYPEERNVDGISVPALHSMQTYGLPTSSSSSSSSSGHGKDRRPIRGSRKAVVVTKKTYLKKEWCKTQPLKQVVRMRGCLRTKILNNFCYGQCNSFFIPKKARRDKKAEAFLSCGFCRPRRFRWILVSLRCPGKNGLRMKRKRVQFIKKCRCMAQEVSMPPFS